MTYEEEVMFGGKMTECVWFLRDLDEGDMIELMQELLLSTNPEKLADVIVAAKMALEGAKDIGVI